MKRWSSLRRTEAPIPVAVMVGPPLCSLSSSRPKRSEEPGPFDACPFADPGSRLWRVRDDALSCASLSRLRDRRAGDAALSGASRRRRRARPLPHRLGPRRDRLDDVVVAGAAAEIPLEL